MDNVSYFLGGITMDEFYKSKIKEGEEYPLGNRILNGLMVSIGLYMTFWMLVVPVAILIILLWFTFNDFAKFVALTILFLPGILILFGVILFDKTRPYGPGLYVPGTCPNPHIYQSSQWYQHEAMMDREREEARRNR